MFKELLFGTAGIPLSTEPRNILGGIQQINSLDLGGMELEFVQSTYIKKEKTAEVKAAAKKHNCILSCHGSYYVNLNSLEKQKIHASINRILSAARIAGLCGAFSVTFHAAFYQGVPAEKVYDNVKNALKEITKTLKDEGHTIWIRPETTGKATQFGTVEEIVKLSQEIEQVMPCIDFSHLHARSAGKENTLKEFSATLEKIEKGLGKEALNNMHIHVAGIAYSEKGERNHLELKDSDMNYKDLMKSLKTFKAKGLVVCESPNLEQDALLMKKAYESI